MEGIEFKTLNESSSSSDGRQGGPNLLADADNEDRLGFVKKVYAILASQLTLTFGFVAVVKSSDTLNESLPNHVGILWAAIILGICIEIALICCKSVARKSPANMILLTLFTICETYMVGTLCALYSAEVVVTAAFMTMVLSITLMVYAYFTKTDFTKCCGPFVCWGIILIMTVSMLLSALSVLLFSYTAQWYPFAAGFGVIIGGLFLLIDTQLIVGGRRHELSIDDYVLGALILYLDIIYIFMELLRLFGSND